MDIDLCIVWNISLTFIPRRSLKNLWTPDNEINYSAYHCGVKGKTSQCEGKKSLKPFQ